MKLKDILLEDFQPNDEYLYHVTHIDKLDEIKERGLVPKFGDLVKKTSGYGFWKEYLEDGSLPPEAKKIEGVIFFSEEPDLGYYNIGLKKSEFDLSDVLVCLVKKNESIYKYVNHGRGEVVDHAGRTVYKVRWRRNSISTEYIPFFIEPGDWFTFESQIVDELLYGEDLYDFLEKYYPNKIR